MTTERYVKRHINKSDYRGHCICVDTHSMVSHRDASIAVICLDFGRIGCTQHENALSLKKGLRKLCGAKIRFFTFYTVLKLHSLNEPC